MVVLHGLWWPEKCSPLVNRFAAVAWKGWNATSGSGGERNGNMNKAIYPHWIQFRELKIAFNKL
jgi:hypothetical protein